jgi:hypothetical protein
MRNDGNWLALGAFISAFAMISWMALDSACTDMGQRSEVSECWRGWIGSWSGWAAAIGALFAAVWTVTAIRRQISLQALQHRHTTLKAEQDDLLSPTNALIAVIHAADYVLSQTKLIGRLRTKDQFRVFVRNTEGQNGLAALNASAPRVLEAHANNANLVRIYTERLLAYEDPEDIDFENEIFMVTETFPKVIEVLRQDREQLSARLNQIKTDLKGIESKIRQFER